MRIFQKKDWLHFLPQLGVLEPLIVRLSTQKQGQYEIVAGDRRFRAAKLAGLTVVPCLFSNYTNEQAAQIALIENICREELNPIAEAIAIKRLATEFNYTHEEIGLLLGVSRSHISNLLRLLNLDERIQHWMMLSKHRIIRNEKSATPEKHRCQSLQ